MSFWVKKENGELTFRETCAGYETRNPSTMWCLQEADKVHCWRDFPEIKIYTGDEDDDPSKRDGCTFSKKKGEESSSSFLRIVPDFNFHGWPQVGIPDYVETTRQISEAGSTPCRINKVGWIGNIHTNRHRRGRLMELGNEHPDMFDFHSMEWNSVAGQIFLEGSKYTSLPELAKAYSILLDIEGCGYSGRLKYLLWSKRPVLLVHRSHEEFFFEHLEQWVHYIPVKQDLSDLVEKTQWCLENEGEANEIAGRAFEFSQRYLTREACYEQWNRVVIYYYSRGETISM